jgi:hypothetical protein
VVSHFGVSLPGSPFEVTVNTTLPCARHCIVRGNALSSVVSRNTNTFEVLFRDRLGQTAHAVDLDVFVEPVTPSSPRSKPPPTEEELEALRPEAVAKARAALEAIRRREAAERVAQEEREREEREKEAAQSGRRGKGKGGASASPKSPQSPKGVAAVAVADFAHEDEKGEHAALLDGPEEEEAAEREEGEGEGGGGDGVSTKYRKIRVKVCDKPLLLRADFAKESTQLGRLMPGSVVTVVEERITADRREVRGCVALDSVGDAIDALVVGGNTPVASPRRSRSSSSSSGGGGATPRTPRGARVRSEKQRPATSREERSTSGSSIDAPMGQRPRPQSARPRSGRAAAGLRLDDSRHASRLADLLLGGGKGGALDQTAIERGGGRAAGAFLHSGSGDGGERAAVGVDDDDGAPRGASAGGTARTVLGSVLEAGINLVERVAGMDLDGDGNVGRAEEGLSAHSTVPEGGELPLTGWVTLIKDGRKLVTSRVKLGPGSRRQFLRQWERRKANNKRESTKAAKGSSNSIVTSELWSDPTGIGFGFGGVEPGVLHAHGQLHDVHRVSYSLGLAGDYFLHVRLRQEALPLPGSPFLLTVSPAAAHGRSSRLPAGPLRGKVGLGADDGCEAVLYTADRVGNKCNSGGAAVEIRCEHAEITTEIDDQGDGSYILRWRSKHSGTFPTRVTIDEIDCLGSPATIALTSSTPQLSLSEMSGEGLRRAVAGEQASISIKFVDQFSNTAIPSSSMGFGMAFLKEKEKLSTSAACHPFETEWEAGGTGVCTLKYVAKAAGSCGLHVWCEPDGGDERTPLPGSPFTLQVGAGKASPDVSQVDGWSKLVKEEKQTLNKAGQQAADTKTLFAGDTLSIKPQIFDSFGNAAALEEGALKVVHESPSGSRQPMHFTQQNRGGQTSYDVRHDTSLAGDHKVHITISGESLKGSPLSFYVNPDRADPPQCKLSAPNGGPLYANQSRSCTLKTFDRFGNECVVGGMNLTCRLQLMKQGVHDQTALVPANHSISAEDVGDGTYLINVWFAMPCMVKLFVNMDKNLPTSVAELPPVTLHCIENPASGEEASAEPSPSSKSPAAVQTPQPSPPDGSPDKTPKDKNQKLRMAAGEMMLGFGAAGERREKDAVLVAAEAFADGSDGFLFDRMPAEAAASSLKRRGSVTIRG